MTEEATKQAVQQIKAKVHRVRQMTLEKSVANAHASAALEVVRMIRAAGRESVVEMACPSITHSQSDALMAMTATGCKGPDAQLIAAIIGNPKEYELQQRSALDLMCRQAQQELSTPGVRQFFLMPGLHMIRCMSGACRRAALELWSPIAAFAVVPQIYSSDDDVDRRYNVLVLLAETPSASAAIAAAVKGSGSGGSGGGNSSGVDVHDSDSSSLDDHDKPHCLHVAFVEARRDELQDSMQCCSCGKYDPQPIRCPRCVCRSYCSMLCQQQDSTQHHCIDSLRFVQYGYRMVVDTEIRLMHSWVSILEQTRASTGLNEHSWPELAPVPSNPYLAAYYMMLEHGLRVSQSVSERHTRMARNRERYALPMLPGHPSSLEFGKSCSLFKELHGEIKM